MRYDAVVIGGGVSGLTNALLLAHFGQRVAVVEQAAVSAPLIRGFSRRGVLYDTGFHYAGGMGDGEVLDRFFNFFDLADQIETLPFAANGFDRVIASDSPFTFDFPVGESSLRQSLVDAFPQEQSSIDTFIRDVMAVCDGLPYLNLHATFGQQGIFDSLQDISLADYLQQLTGNRRLQYLLSLHCLLHGSAPQQIPFRLHAAVIGPYFRSVHGVRGGGARLAEAFDHCLRRAGVDMLCSARVDKIHVSQDRQVSGVELATGQVLECRAVINAADPRLLLSWLPDGLFRPVYRRRLQALEETFSAHILFAPCNNEPEPLKQRNLYLAAVDSGLQLCPSSLEQRPFYLTSASEGPSTGVMGILPARFDEVENWQQSSRGKRPVDYQMFKQQLGDRLMKRIRHAVPEVAEQMGEPFIATPLTLRDYMYTERGAVYGIRHEVEQYPLQAATRVRGLFLSGQALIAPGVMGAMVGAFYTCGAMFGHERVLEELNQCS
ncbi:MAG: NAD(P)/FAD-dependent oxidoreductase [Desulfuromonas sp.]|nr:NAD(P)/FAD-dependent oxidoreductase [Desulfuromonas sp.]